MHIDIDVVFTSSHTVCIVLCTNHHLTVPLNVLLHASGTYMRHTRRVLLRCVSFRRRLLMFCRRREAIYITYVHLLHWP